MIHRHPGILIVLSLAAPLAAQPIPHPQPDAQPTESTPPGAAQPAVPSLDELLGLDNDAGPDDRADLERQLSAQEAGKRFQQAITLMGDAAKRIPQSGGMGIQTQRIQEEILRKLDQVIEAARRNQSGGAGQSRSQSQAPQGGQQPNQSTQTQQAGQPGADNTGENMAPALSGVGMNPALAPDAATWGNLPERARDAVSQGVADRYSAIYRRMTELYYRKLAEQDRAE